MVTKSKLRLALAAEKGVDFKKLKEKRKLKARNKQDATQRGGGAASASPSLGSDDDNAAELKLHNGQGEHSSDDEEAGEVCCGLMDSPCSSSLTDWMRTQMNLDAVDDSDTSDSSLEMEEKIDRKALKLNSQLETPGAKEEVGGDEDEDEDDEDIPVSDLEDLDDEEREDLIPHTRLTINNTSALLAALTRIAIPTDKTAPFASHQSIVASAETADSIPDVADDLQRELAFYSQSLEAVRLARSKLRAEGVPFSRPKDYFAEMVKEDAHMERVKAKLTEEAAGKKAAAEARKLRDLKKFGKQVQVAKLQERHKEKRETLDKIKTLKRSQTPLPQMPYCTNSLTISSRTSRIWW